MKKIFSRRTRRDKHRHQYIHTHIPTTYDITLTFKPTITIQLRHDDGSTIHVYDADLTQIRPQLLTSSASTQMIYQYSYDYHRK